MIDVLFRQPLLVALVIFGALTASFIGMTLLGMRIGRGFQGEDGKTVMGTGAIDGAVFALFGLLIAFTFYGAAERFQVRKLFILEEAKAISTAWSRLDLLPEPDRARLRELFRDYLDRRLTAYGKSRDLSTFQRHLAGAEEVGQEILTTSAAACRAESGQPFAEVIMPAVNAMSDIALTRKAAIRAHPPAAIYGLLFGVSLAATFLIGLAMSPSKRKSWIHIAGFSALVAATLYVTADLEMPRMGLIRVAKADALLREVRASMGSVNVPTRLEP
ncbi:MAG TPA: DUF4239 domain-containing protein [Planctomycetota bacterium]